MVILLGLLFGFAQGLRHAFEPDHVVALSTMITEAPSGRTRVAYAAAWGIGHAAMLLVVGAILMAARTQLSSRLDAAFEVAVSVMLIVLGVRALLLAIVRRHAHAQRTAATPKTRTWLTLGPLAMGVIHGLAGSGALTALVVARLPSPRMGLVFVLVFGAGATLGMTLLASVASAPLSHMLRKRWGMPALLGATGLLSFCLGLTWLPPALQHAVGP